ncbi:hypothetical protein B0H17DRAFT_1132959 [Mycena rosella]|uniref:Uncharacterized protein n=1 Tax=Mycena rosella TaxID=1033263 RepID=A0AAD7DJA7_MYCRO|nr:hypothetical protein B0H17DRAFT_1132959 [Mycena rosella]
MAINGVERSKHTAADLELLDGLSARQLMDFRNHSQCHAPVWMRRQRAQLFLIRHPVSVKIEAPLLPVLRASAVAVKAEPEVPGLPSRSAPIKTRVLTEGGREVLELFSDSEPDASGVESDLEVVQALKPTSRSPSIIPFDFIPGSDDTESAIFGAASSPPEDFEDLDDLVESDTVWQDDITSLVRTGNFKLTQKVSAQRIKYISDLASIYPIIRDTVIVVDLSDPKYDLDNIKTGEPYTLDHLIRNADNDSWDAIPDGMIKTGLGGASRMHSYHWYLWEGLSKFSTSHSNSARTAPDETLIACFGMPPSQLPLITFIAGLTRTSLRRLQTSLLNIPGIHSTLTVPPPAPGPRQVLAPALLHHDQLSSHPPSTANFTVCDRCEHVKPTSWIKAVASCPRFSFWTIWTTEYNAHPHAGRPSMSIFGRPCALSAITNFILRWDPWMWAGRGILCMVFPDGGGSHSKASVRFEPGGPFIQCRRARSECKGAYACERIDPALRTPVRFELDSTSRDAVLAALADTRRNEGTTPEQHVALFLKVVRDAKCLAVDSNGKKCDGGPMMKAKPNGKSRGQDYFITCSGWAPRSHETHRTHSIPDFVNANLLAKGLAGQPLTTDPDKDTKPCSRIIHPHTGLRQKLCRRISHAHIINGTQALLVTNNTGHNHSMPSLTKVSFGTKATYRECIKGNGVLGATVSKIDNGSDAFAAQSTKMILNGKTPSAFAPALHNKRVKRGLVRDAKRAVLRWRNAANPLS